MSITKVFFGLLFCLIACTAMARADQNILGYDSSHVDVRHMDKNEIEKLKADPDMEYGQSPAVLSLWERFKRWFKSFLNSLFFLVETTDWVRTLLVILAILLMVYVILRLLKVNAFNMVYSKKKQKLAYGVLEEDIHSMDFDALVQAALQRQEFRLAIRLLFLHALKMLADNHHILWEPGKTNHDYLEELKAQHLKTGFNELNFYFEYAWYGNFTVHESLFKKAEAIFRDWRSNV